jgi:hypothetical protein
MKYLSAVLPIVLCATVSAGLTGTCPRLQPEDRIDVADENLNGIAEFAGRLINPPFLFGSGGVESRNPGKPNADVVKD